MRMAPLWRATFILIGLVCLAFADVGAARSSGDQVRLPAGGHALPDHAVRRRNQSRMDGEYRGERPRQAARHQVGAAERGQLAPGATDAWRALRSVGFGELRPRSA